ncbi:MAG: class I SAM-dependent methyltransferase [Gammaproteobacteria bacterium]|nr:class I SAM-dependent methyltransferase [Gammaproteobacteria bacterium]
MPTPITPSAFVKEAYSLEDEGSMVDFYKKWAADYDHEMLDQLGYSAPTQIARLLSEQVTDTRSQVFDIGCGTGLTCVFLAEKGYANLDGIDLSADMVGVAGERGIYRELLVGDVNLALPLEDASYDAAISSGTFTHGHVGPGPLSEIFRILKPGGILACTVHQGLWESMGFRASFEALVNQQIAQQVSLELDSYYKNGPSEGWFCIYRKST